MGQPVYYTNELPAKDAMITIHDAMSSLSPEAVVRANETGVLPACDMHYFEVSWMSRRRGVGPVTYVHRFVFESYRAAQDAQRQFERVMQGKTENFVDIYYALRIKDTEDKMTHVRYNRQKAREWEEYLRQADETTCIRRKD